MSSQRIMWRRDVSSLALSVVCLVPDLSSAFVCPRSWRDPCLKRAFCKGRDAVKPRQGKLHHKLHGRFGNELGGLRVSALEEHTTEDCSETEPIQALPGEAELPFEGERSSRRSPRPRRGKKGEGGILALRRAKWRKRSRLRSKQQSQEPESDGYGSKGIESPDIESPDPDGDEKLSPGRWRRFRIRRERIAEEMTEPSLGGGEKLVAERAKTRRQRKKATATKKVRRSERKAASTQGIRKLPLDPSLSFSAVGDNSPPLASDDVDDKSFSPKERTENPIRPSLISSDDETVLPETRTEEIAALPPKESGEQLKNQEDGVENDGGGKRVAFSATHSSTRPLLLDDRTRVLLGEYMTQPVERYSVKSFHDNTESTGVSSVSTQRRWRVRRLTAEESLQYRKTIDDVEGNATSVAGDGDVFDTMSDNCFRLAVPLQPLVGLDLTPIIDLKVIPPVIPEAFSSSVAPEDDSQESKDQDDANVGKRRLRGVWRRITTRSAKDGKDDLETVRIKSLRVSLLSKGDDVDSLMQSSSPRSSERQASELPVTAAATAVSQNESVQQMGNEAIGMVSKLGEWVKPQLTFEAKITWCDGGDAGESDDTNSNAFRKKKRRRTGSSVTVQSTVSTCLTIPPLPVGVSSFFVKQLGSAVTKQALTLALPRFLVQLERDFDRWASVEKSND